MFAYRVRHFSEEMVGMQEMQLDMLVVRVITYSSLNSSIAKDYFVYTFR